MSAITGIFRRDNKEVDLADIKKMTEKLAHRGPDGSQIWCDGSVAFGHQMLHTTLESINETLPFEDKESGLVITADARIDNRKELKPKLGLEDNEYVSDSLFILKAYEKWGEKCLEELLGDFSFAIWDKNKQKLICARDHMGVKPFYYYKDDNVFLFATEIKALLTILDLPNRLNNLKIALFLKMVRTDKKFTFYKDIFSLSAAHFLSVGKKNFRKNAYWKLDHNAKIKMKSDRDYFNLFLEIFTEAVECRLRSPFPVGFDLSGGLDSSSIVCVAKEILKENDNDLNVFSQIYDDFPESDERYYINKVIEKGGINPHFVKCDEISPLDEIETVLWYQDQPFHNPFLPVFCNIFKKMQENSIRVRLTGIGGDVVISHGSGYFLELAVSLKWHRLVKEIKAYSKHKNKSFINEITKVFFSLMPEFLQKITSSSLNHLRKHWFPIKVHNNMLGAPIDFINIEFLKKTKFNDYSEKIGLKKIGKRNAARNHHYNMVFKISEQESFEMVNHASESYSIECRFPFYDKRLVEFCYAVPTEIKFRLGWDRFLLRNSMRDILPQEIQWRPGKTNLIPLLKRNLLSLEKDCLEEMIYGNDGIIHDYINLDVIKNSYNEYKLTNNISYVPVYNMWQTMLLFKWLQK